MKTRTFRTASGTKVRVYMTEEQIAQQEAVKLAAILMPILMILLFAVAGGMI